MADADPRRRRDGDRAPATWSSGIPGRDRHGRLWIRTLIRTQRPDLARGTATHARPDGRQWTKCSKATPRRRVAFDVDAGCRDEPEPRVTRTHDLPDMHPQ